MAPGRDRRRRRSSPGPAGRSRRSACGRPPIRRRGRGARGGRDRRTHLDDLFQGVKVRVWRAEVSMIGAGAFRARDPLATARPRAPEESVPVPARPGRLQQAAPPLRTAPNPDPGLATDADLWADESLADRLHARRVRPVAPDSEALVYPEPASTLSSRIAIPRREPDHAEHRFWRDQLGGGVRARSPAAHSWRGRWLTSLCAPGSALRDARYPSFWNGGHPGWR